MRDKTSTKCQAPNYKQAPNLKHQAFEVWNLSFVWDLEFEIYEG
jgi:hypothetical protein